MAGSARFFKPKKTTPRWWHKRPGLEPDFSWSVEPRNGSVRHVEAQHDLARGLASLDLLQGFADAASASVGDQAYLAAPRARNHHAWRQNPPPYSV